MTDHGARKHALFSASGMKRLMQCPGSFRMQQHIPDKSSVFADRGTALHEIVEKVLKNTTFDIHAQEVLGDPITEREVEAVQTCIDFAKQLIGPGDEWELEQQFDLSDFREGWGGIGDLTVYKPYAKELHVADWKFGYRLVDAFENPQCLTYALGAATRHHNRGVEKIVIWIVQPLATHPKGPIRDYETTYEDLLIWSQEAVQAIEASQQPDAPLVAGDECKFCKAAATCPAKFQATLAEAQAEFSQAEGITVPDPTSLNLDQLKAVWDSLDRLEGYCKAVRDFVHHEAEAGRMLPGTKLVASRPSRRWQDEETAKAALQLLWDVADEHIYQRPKFNSPAQVEAALKKHYGFKGAAADAAIKDYYNKTSSGTVVVPLDDPRPPVRPEAETEFTAVE